MFSIRISILCILFSVTLLSAQDNSHPLSGEWPGYIDIPGTKLEVNFDFNYTGETWSGTLDIPLQGIKDMALGELKVWGDSLSFSLPEVPGDARFKGAVDKTGEGLSGNFSQAGFDFPMLLTKKSAAEKAAAFAKRKEALEKITAIADSFLIARNHPGMGMGIILDGEVLLSRGFGFRDVENQKPVTDKTLFAIGSSSKAFTAMGAAILVEDGKLDWDEPIKTYLPDFALMDEFATKEMNMVDLLCHRSGLPRHDLMWYGTDFSREEIFKRMKYLKPNKSFRTTWQYQNLMFMTAGYLVGKLSGNSWEEFTKERIFKALEMNGSNLSVTDMQKTEDFALPYSINKDKKAERVDFKNIDAVGPAGSINSSVEYMLKWLRFLTHTAQPGEKTLINNETKQFLFAPKIPIAGGVSPMEEFSLVSYGLGWMTYDYTGSTIVEHGGNIDGFSALVWLVPEENLGIVVLTNTSGSGLPGVMARTATTLLLDKEPVDWFDRAYGLSNAANDAEKKEEEKKDERPRVNDTKPAHKMSEYAGKYDHPGYGTAEIVFRNDSLIMQYYHIKMNLEHWHFETFNAKLEILGVDNLITFQTDENGKIVSLSMKMDPVSESEVFVKLPDSHLSDPVFLSKISGDYELESQKMTVSLRDKKVTLMITGQTEYELEAYRGNEFKLKGLNGFMVEFIFNEDDTKAVEMKFIQPNGIFVAKRKK